MLFLSGVLVISGGAALLVWPVAGLGAIVVVFGYVALFFGLFQISIGLHVRAWSARLTTRAVV
jgi:uncharacterized membrane protein HdeD (DUF308 family)